MKRALFGIALFVSLALNVTLIAENIAAGNTLVTRAQPLPRPYAFMALAKQLPDNVREEMKDELKQKRQDIKSAMQDIKTERQNVFEYMTSDAYTHEEAARKLAALREKTTALQQISQEMILDIADKMTPEQRKNLLLQLKDKIKF